jgi:hypothetical protein
MIVYYKKGYQGSTLKKGSIMEKSIQIEFDTKIQSYIEANQSYADELFNIARQHRITYITLNKNAMNLYKPVLNWFEEKKLYNECIRYMYKNIPDCIERTLYIKTLIDKLNGK